MTKYHISPETGRPNICRADTKSCPIKDENGNPTPHFEDKAEAKAYAEKNLVKEYGQVKELKKDSVRVVENSQVSSKKVDFVIPDFEDFDYYNSVPKDYDTVFSVVLEREANAARRQHSAFRAIQRNSGNITYQNFKQAYKQDPDVVLRNALNEEHQPGSGLYSAVNEYKKQAEIRNTYRNFASDMEKIYGERGSWSRAFLVSEGHLHKSMDCSTCNKNGKRTQFAFMTDYSGMDENDIVDDAGYRACTTCYPSAPVGDERTLPSKMFTPDEKQKHDELVAQREKLAQKKADAASKAPSITGEPLEVRLSGSSYGIEKFKTERTAVMWFTDNLHSALNRGDDLTYNTAARKKVLYEIALKKDVPMKELYDDWLQKAVLKETYDKKSAKADAARRGWKEVAKAHKLYIDDFGYTEDEMNRSPREWSNDPRLENM